MDFGLKSISECLLLYSEIDAMHRISIIFTRQWIVRQVEQHLQSIFILFTYHLVIAYAPKFFHMKENQVFRIYSCFSAFFHKLRSLALFLCIFIKKNGKTTEKQTIKQQCNEILDSSVRVIYGEKKFKMRCSASEHI